MKSQSAQIPKKPYKAPKLLEYGDLTEMTKARGPRGRLDGGRRFGRTRSGR